MLVPGYIQPRSSVGGFAEETLVDRLTRFAGILKVCGGEGGDVARAVKVLDKLAQVRRAAGVASSFTLCAD